VVSTCAFAKKAAGRWLGEYHRAKEPQWYAGSSTAKENQAGRVLREQSADDRFAKSRATWNTESRKTANKKEWGDFFLDRLLAIPSIRLLPKVF